MTSLTTVLKRLVHGESTGGSASAPGGTVPPVPVDPGLPDDFSWGVVTGGNGDICVCVAPFSPSRPVKAAILVHAHPLASRYGPASPFVLAVRYEDGSSARRILAEAGADTTAKVAAAPSVLVSESDETGGGHLYAAYVLHPGDRV